MVTITTAASVNTVCIKSADIMSNSDVIRWQCMKKHLSCVGRDKKCLLHYSNHFNGGQKMWGETGRRKRRMNGKTITHEKMKAQKTMKDNVMRK
jgi:hypothetical protein